MSEKRYTFAEITDFLRSGLIDAAYASYGNGKWVWHDGEVWYENDFESWKSINSIYNPSKAFVIKSFNNIQLELELV